MHSVIAIGKYLVLEPGGRVTEAKHLVDESFYRFCRLRAALVGECHLSPRGCLPLARAVAVRRPSGAFGVPQPPRNAAAPRGSFGSTPRARPSLLWAEAPLLRFGLSL